VLGVKKRYVFYKDKSKNKIKAEINYDSNIKIGDSLLIKYSLFDSTIVEVVKNLTSK